MDSSECQFCGNEWDGYAQCNCSSQSDDTSSINSDACQSDDTSSVNSDAGPARGWFEETGHIAMETTRKSIQQMLIEMETTRKSIQQMLILARSHEETTEVPEWINETCDYSTNGLFVDGKYHVSAYEELGARLRKKHAMTLCPMLTDEECDIFTKRMDAWELVDDIVDHLNIQRLRKFDEANRKFVWVGGSHWDECEQPKPELITISD